MNYLKIATFALALISAGPSFAADITHAGCPLKLIVNGKAELGLDLLAKPAHAAQLAELKAILMDKGYSFTESSSASYVLSVAAGSGYTAIENKFSIFEKQIVPVHYEINFTADGQSVVELVKKTGFAPNSDNRAIRHALELVDAEIPFCPVN